MAAAAMATSETRAARDRMAAARRRLATARPRPKAADSAPCTPQKAAPTPTATGTRYSERRVMSNATWRSTGGAGATGALRSASSTAAPPASRPRGGGVERLHLGLVLVVALGAEPDHADQEEHDREHRHDPEEAIEAVAHGGEDGQREGQLDALDERVGEALVELSPCLEIV